MSYFEAVLETLQSIQKEMKATRHAILHQTKLLQEDMEKRKGAITWEVAAPAPKAITWQEAVKVLADECAKVSGCDCVLDKCPMHGWCSYARKGNAPAYWVVPLYEKEAASDE